MQPKPLEGGMLLWRQWYSCNAYREGQRKKEMDLLSNGTEKAPEFRNLTIKLSSSWSGECLNGLKKKGREKKRKREDEEE